MTRNEDADPDIAGPLDDDALRIYQGGQRLYIGLGDHELAVGLSKVTDDARFGGATTWIVDHDGNRLAAVVPAAIAEAAAKAVEAASGTCKPCAEGRHEDCAGSNGSGDGSRCGCDQRSLHASILGQRVLLYRASRRR
ncbi:MAG: hypothetical protein JWM19_931 [Actinomycetia bacterium]|nr:hypothetical protein [Actinomycetes bacterium]